MSSPFTGPGQNPYSSPLQPSMHYSAPPDRNLPTFPKVIFITDLVLCTIRIGLVLLGLVGFVTMKQQDPNSPMLASVTFELLTGVAIVLTGMPASIAMLMKQSWGTILAWLCVLATLASLGVGIWQLTLMIDAQAPPGTPQRIGFIIGGGLMALIRLGILALYATAVVNFSNWQSSLRSARFQA